MFPRKPLSAAISRMLLPAALLLASCSGVIFDPPSAVDLAPFKEWARARGCDDIRNRLFLIDDQLVFSDVAGNCADGAYGRTLFGSTPDEVLCVFHDSIAGPVNECQAERYRDIFDTMTANLDEPDLGLGAEHTVQPVPLCFLFC